MKQRSGRKQKKDRAIRRVKLAVNVSNFLSTSQPSSPLMLFRSFSPFLSLFLSFEPSRTYKNKQPSFPRQGKREFLITGNFVSVYAARNYSPDDSPLPFFLGPYALAAYGHTYIYTHYWLLLLFRAALKSKITCKSTSICLRVIFAVTFLPAL